MKILITNYSFNASAKTITFNDYASIDLERILLITNVTDNIIIYNFADPTKGGTVSGNVLTLTYNTTSMSNTDDLQIFYEDIGKVSSGGDTSTIYNGITALTPKFVAISASTSGDNTLVSAVSGKKIRVLALSAVVSAATNIYFTSGAGGTVIFGGSTNKINIAANSGLVLGFNPVGWFETASGQALVVNLSAGNSFSGGLVYIEV